MATYHDDGIMIMDSKYPDDKLDYGWNFEPFLAQYGDEDSIQTAAVADVRGLTISGLDFSDGTWVYIWIEGGAEGNTYLVTCEGTTVNGRKKRWSFYLPVGKTQVVPS